LAFNSAGGLFVTDQNGNAVYEFNPGGARSTFASGLANPSDLAFDSAGNMFVTMVGNGTVVEFEAGGGESIFASGLSIPGSIAIQGQTLSVPEPPTFGFLTIAATALLIVRHRGSITN